MNKYEEENAINQTRTSRDASRPLSKSQKISVVVLAFFAFFTVVLWTVETRKNLSGPNNRIQRGAESAVSDKNESDLYTKDTDEDGLTDWEELNTYKTSPYLPDSDSDGFLDKKEVDSGHDPNCPEGRECYGRDLTNDRKQEETGNINNNSIQDFLEQLSAENPNKPGENAPDNKKLEEMFSGGMDAAALRQMLLGSGMDKKILDQFNDEELVSAYKEILGD